MSPFLSRLRIYPLNVDAMARALAAPLLRDFDADMLDQTATIQYLRTRYMRAVAEYGLPADAANVVADRAFALIAKTTRASILQTPFVFYE